MHPIPEILEDLRAGRVIVLVDDEDRENEGDLVVAAQHATPEVVNFMLREGRGLMCVALAPEICDRLELGVQGRTNTSLRSTAYTVTVDAAERFGVTTGVSAADRSRTIRVLIDEATRPEDLAKPGHLQPLRARVGGCLVRAGQTEGSVDLCTLARLRPGAAIIEVMRPDGEMARRPELEELCAKHNLKMCSVADLVQYRLEREKLVERIAVSELENDLGKFRLIAYESQVDPFPHVALVCGDLGRCDAAGRPIDVDEPVLVRMHSHNLLGDVFGDLAQPSGETLRRAMQRIQAEGRGALVYLRHERVGSGLLQRLQTPTMPADDRFASTDRPQLGASHSTPGVKPPTNKGAYGIGAQILRDLGIRKLRLLTDHPFTPTALSGFGLSISEFVPLHDR